MSDSSRWSLSAGDPTFLGWSITVGYVIVFLLSLFVFWMGRTKPLESDPKATSWFWLFLAWLMCFLALNKQLDLQNLFTQIGRVHAAKYGWLDYKREVQAVFVFVLLSSFSLIASWFVMVNRQLIVSQKFAFIGLLFVVGYVFLKAALFYHVIPFGRSAWYEMIEILGLICIAISALRYFKRQSLNSFNK